MSLFEECMKTTRHGIFPANPGTNVLPFSSPPLPVRERLCYVLTSTPPPPLVNSADLGLRRRRISMCLF
ncbi:hypothetical protein CgunFtcFv8_022904 [Champsocephalus gunnari]|uniref:Uncharacterized protein n=1 Tax=Champsocephalus gunnari TaxID=52237 RepID=A0AAN8HKX0_CHAGU|nr:hypothetical protein CgunFtcFv8_022904 [Champsocephalus gunnari]